MGTDHAVDRYQSVKHAGGSVKIGNSTFEISGKTCYVTDMSDYTIVSDFDVTPFVNGYRLTATDLMHNASSTPQFADTANTNGKRKRQASNQTLADPNKSLPDSLRMRLTENWVHSVHIQSVSKPLVTRDKLKSRVLGGQILAYHYKECSLEGNRCVYYGFIPTLPLNATCIAGAQPQLSELVDVVGFNDLAKPLPTSLPSSLDSSTERCGSPDERSNNVNGSGFHKTSVINVQHIWLRKLYVNLTKSSMCPCSEGCVKVSIVERNRMTATKYRTVGPRKTYCIRDVPWNNVYVIMGDVCDNVVENILKPHRECKPCAQCFKCSQSPTFCREHKVCKHKKHKISEQEFIMSEKLSEIPKIKKCKKVC